MDILDLPDEIAIGGADARAAQLQARSEQALAEARRLVIRALSIDPRPAAARTLAAPRDRHGTGDLAD